MATIAWTELNPAEKSRTYTFPTGLRITYDNVVRIEIRESGKHRIETADGKKAFICPGWVALDIDTPVWSC